MNRTILDITLRVPCGDELTPNPALLLYHAKKKKVQLGMIAKNGIWQTNSAPSGNNVHLKNADDVPSRRANKDSKSLIEPVDAEKNVDRKGARS